MANEGNKLIANNKKAYHDYFVENEIEAGIVLHGTEVKSLRMGKCSIKESFIRIINDEAFVMGMNISPYEKGNIFNKDPLRVRKLLMHNIEIKKLLSQVTQKGYSLIPLKVYFNKGRAKLLVGLCKGKKLHDKREVMANRTQRLEVAREHKINIKL